MIFDTDILVWLLRRHPEAIRFVDRVPPPDRNLSAGSYLELVYGCRDAEDIKQIQRLVFDLFAEIVPLTEVITASGVRLMENYALSHRPDVTDVLIGATALTRGEMLATGNLKHFDFIPGLEIKAFRP